MDRKIKNSTAAILIILMTGLLILPVGDSSVKAANADNYVPGQLYVKYSPGAAKTAGGISADNLLEELGAVKSKQAFQVPANRSTSSAGKISAGVEAQLESLSRIKLVDFSPDLDMEYIARKLSAHPDIEYAEPVYYQHLDSSPNDPFFLETDVFKPNQEYLNYINAPGAWDIATGDSKIVIAIVDSGTDWNHPDLLANVWYNPEELPGYEGLDNGYEDDIHGWDFYGGEDALGNPVGDNNPTGVGEPHGTHVAGIAAAVTNNGLGVASLSHNVKFMPVKAGADSADNLLFGYQGILYAANNGADIINCSWGSEFFSLTAQEVIATADSLGSIVIASAGNENRDAVYYPAGYPNVFGVASIDIEGINEGRKSSFSNYGSYVDVSAPGRNIYSTVFDGEYDYLNGTSMSAPIVSALAALIKSKNPDWDSERIRAQIAGTSTPINDPNGYLRGTGYINAELAMGEPVLFVEVVDYVFSDPTPGNGDGLFSIEEDISVSLTIKNMGEDVDSLSFEIFSSTEYSTPSITSMNIGSLNHGEQIVIDDLSFLVSGEAPFDAKEYILLTFKSAESVSYDVIEFIVNPSYATMTANMIDLSFDVGGHIGYIDYSANSTGISFIIRDNSQSQDGVYNVPLLFEGGLLFGTGPDRVSNSVRTEDQLVADEDFSSSSPIEFVTAPDSSKQEGTIVFSDEDAGETSNNVSVTLNTLAYNEDGNDQYLIFAYTFRNDGIETLTNFTPGLFFDFDVPEFSADDDYMFYSGDDDILVVSEDSELGGDKIFIGVTVAGSIGSPWIIENASTDSTLFGIYDGFTDKEKWRSLSSEKRDDNLEGNGDVSMVVSSESFDLIAGEEKQVIFIIGYGIGYDELKLQITNARKKAEMIAVSVDDSQSSDRPEEFSLKPLYPNPFNGRTTVSYYLPSDTSITATIYDMLGRKIDTVFDGYETSGEHTIILNGDNLSSGLYFLSIETKSGMHAFRKFTVLK
ncbi:S8/S53 family peptidase [Candidatus Latescibacterota bacterium]